MPPGRRRAFVIACSVLGALALLWAGNAAVPMVFVNRSFSAPEGVYVREGREKLRRGTYVAMDTSACTLPYPTPTFLIKRVWGVAGDEVRSGADGVVINAETVCGGRLPGVEADHAVDVDRTLARGEFFLINEPPESLDSRYFGVVERECLVPVRMIWEWAE